MRLVCGEFLAQSRNAPAPQASGCLSEANPKGRKGPREAQSRGDVTQEMAEQIYEEMMSK